MKALIFAELRQFPNSERRVFVQADLIVSISEEVWQKQEGTQGTADTPLIVQVTEIPYSRIETTSGQHVNVAMTVNEVLEKMQQTYLADLGVE